MQDRSLSAPLSKKEEDKEECSDAPAWITFAVAENGCAAETPTNAPATDKSTGANPTPEQPPPAYEDSGCRSVVARCDAARFMARAGLPLLTRHFDMVMELMHKVLDELSETLGGYSTLDLVDTGIYERIFQLCGRAGFYINDDPYAKVGLDLDLAKPLVQSDMDKYFNEVVEVIGLERPIAIAQVVGIMVNAVTKTMDWIMVEKEYRSYLAAQAWAHFIVSTVNRQVGLVCNRLTEGKAPTATATTAATAAPAKTAPATVRKEHKSTIWKRLFNRILGRV
ncbi:hypothetical protein PG994_010792 [Apiospora phragmitis]|uniref:Uncharacterized protein n=1 Tax=Apiospora phragmitis TaxID=2905665 RepID=A0ABR1TR59_9PEZI